MAFSLPPLKHSPLSPNYSERAHGEPIDLIVLHDTQGGYFGAIATFANTHSEVSAHLVLKEDGSEVTQMVPFEKKAWHVCDFNSRSIGIEMAGFAEKGFGENEWQAAANIICYLLHKFKIPPKWAERGEGSGFCRHYDLGRAGGGHSDPTTDNNVWQKFVTRVQNTYKENQNNFPDQWESKPITVQPSPVVHPQPAPVIQPQPTPIPAPPTPPVVQYRDLRYTPNIMIGDDVRDLQQKLLEKGYNIKIDSEFGPETDKAVKAYQRQNNLTSDGIVGPITRKSLGLE